MSSSSSRHRISSRAPQTQTQTQTQTQSVAPEIPHDVAASSSSGGAAATSPQENPFALTSLEEVAVESCSLPVVGPLSYSADVLSGVRVLKLLYVHRICDSLVRESYRRSRVPLLPYKVVGDILRSIHDVLTQCATDGSDRHLSELSTQIFENSSQPLDPHQSMTVEEYISLFTGSQLRWEAIGNVFAVAGRAIIASPDNDPIFVENGAPGRANLLSQIAEASDLCLSFCARESCSNELLVSLQVNDLMLKTQQHGDSSYQSWRRLGDLCATVYFSGIHRQDGDERDPVFLAQLKRGCFASAFYVDKCVATFLGRPPLLNYRHCSLVPPLDLSDDILVGDPACLTEAIEQVSSTGWNCHGRIYRTSLARIRLLLAIFKDKVIELRAGHYDADTLPRANQILEEAQSSWEHCPDPLRYDRFNNADNDDHSNVNRFTIISIYLDYLHSRFLLLQFMAAHMDDSRAAFLETAQKILATVIQATKYRASQIDLSQDYSWITLYYGIPSATLLAQDLHSTRHTQQGPSPPHVAATETIRNLCVLVSMLSWVVSPIHGDYHICKDAERRLSQMVDEILDRVNSPSVDTLASNELFDHMLEWVDYGNLGFGPVLFG
ncbi:putative C6 transcription factor [Leptodontidium sp. MPI-SDFR-AT-0119]|nr:putative C6 transcription factor [Leptodontidium sp. MPI-SDFR-AT-0119]